MTATSLAIDPNKNWGFHFGNLVENWYPIKMEERNGAVNFSIIFDAERNLNFELLSLNQKDQTIEGKYSLGTSDFKDSVTFKILEGGRLLQGTPKGALARHVWTLSVKD